MQVAVTNREEMMRLSELRRHLAKVDRELQKLLSANFGEQATELEKSRSPRCYKKDRHD